MVTTSTSGEAHPLEVGQGHVVEDGPGPHGEDHVLPPLQKLLNQDPVGHDLPALSAR